MLTVAQLLQALEGLDPDARVVVGIIEGAQYDAAYAEQRVMAGAPAAYVCCYERPRAWEGQRPVPAGDGTAALSYDPAAPRCPRCGAEQLGHRVTDPDGRVVCGECGAAYDDPDGGS